MRLTYFSQTKTSHMWRNQTSWEVHGWGRLSWVQCREDGLGCRRGEISLDDGDTVRQAWVGTSHCRLVMLLYVGECCLGVKRYSHTRIVIDESISYTYINRIACRSSLTLIGISWSAMESISERLVPVGTREYGWPRWRSWETGLWGIEVSCRHIDPWEYHECDHCLEPLDTILVMSLILRMFHNLYKKNIIIIAYKNREVNYIW